MKKIILILLTFLLSLTLISCKDKDEVVDDINTPQYELNDYYSDKIKQLIYKDVHKNKNINQYYDIKEEKMICLNRIEDSFIIYYWCSKQNYKCPGMGGFIRLNTEIDGLTFLYSYSTMSLCHEEISNLYLYKDETLLSLSEAYEKEYVNYDQLEYAWETYYLCRYSKEYLEELKNQPIKLEEMTNKAIEFFPQFIENYNDNDYKLEINIMEYPSHRVEKIPAMMLDYQAYEILKMNKIDVCKNGELINTVYVGYTMGEEDKIWLMISVSTDNSINYIRVLEQHETDYPYEDDYDFDLIGAKYEEFSQFIPGPNYTGPQLKYFIVTSSQDALSAVYRFAQYLLEKNN